MKDHDALHPRLLGMVEQVVHSARSAIYIVFVINVGTVSELPNLAIAGRPRLWGQGLYRSTPLLKNLRVCAVFPSMFPEGTWTHPQRVGVGFESGHLPKDSKGQRLPLGGQPPFTQEMPPGDAPLDIRTQLLPDRRESWAVGGSAGPALWERALPARLRELGGSLQVI